MEVTKREIIVGISIFLVMLSIGIIIKNNIEDSINTNNEKYYKALKIDNNEDMFKYAMQTNVGYILAQGNVQAIDPVKKDIEGQYFYIKKEKEEYTRHTRQVEHTRTVGNKTETYYTTEEYWTWDYAGKEEYHVDKFKYLGIEFNYNDISFSNITHKDTVDGGYHIRYQYYVIPSEFQGCLFSKIEDNQFKEKEFRYNTTINNIIQNKENEAGVSSIIFIIVWLILIIAAVIGYVYLDNNYLED